MEAPGRDLPRERSWMGVTWLVLAGAVIAGGWLFFTQPRVLGSVQGLPPKGRNARVDRDLRTIITVAEAIYTDTERYPESIEEMVGFKNEDGSPGIAALESHPRDPWGHSYLYEITPAGRPLATCLGSDNRPGGEGEAADTIVRGPP